MEILTWENTVITEKKAKQMGKNGYKLVKTKFSIQERNKKLKKIFDEAINSSSKKLS